MELKDITKAAITISENASFRDAVAMMVNEQTNTLIAVNEDGIFVGEVNVSDLLDAIVPDFLDGDSIAANFATEEMFEEAVRNATEKPVSEFMKVGVDPIQTSDHLMTVAAHAIANQRAHMPVVDSENMPVGMISRRGLKHILANFLNIKDTA